NPNRLITKRSRLKTGRTIQPRRVPRLRLEKRQRPNRVETLGISRHLLSFDEIAHFDMSPVDQNDLNDFYEDDQPFQPQLTPEELKTLKERKKLQALFSEANTAVNCMKIVREIEGICS